MIRAILIVLGLIVLAAIVPDSAQAQFYKGKTITMIVNYPAGGPTDLEGRIVALHLPAHIPGNPTIVVKNVGGAGGLIGSNQLGEAAPNGESIGFFTLDVPGQLIGNFGAAHALFRFRADRRASRARWSFTSARTRRPASTSPADLMKTQEFKALSLNAQNTNTLNQTLALDLLGVKYHAIPAYRGLKEVETAILQNIGQLANSSLSGWSGSVEPTMGHVVMPLWQLSPRKNGSYPRSKALPNLQTFEEFYASVHPGKPLAGNSNYQALRAVERSAARDVPRGDDAAEIVRRGRCHHARGVRRNVEEPAISRGLFQGHQDRADPGHRRRGPGGAERACHASRTRSRSFSSNTPTT